VPTGKPGGRAPHVWLPDERSLFDAFGFEWTLLRLGPRWRSAEPFVKAARAINLDLMVVDCDDEEAYDLYEADLALIRPDQVVAWRHSGGHYADPHEVFARVLGRE
jgi:hypothetical protein